MLKRVPSISPSPPWHFEHCGTGLELLTRPQTLRDCQRFNEPDYFSGGLHENLSLSIDEGKTMSEPKDFWDKAEIVGKVLTCPPKLPSI
jgi:hypothetical protein